MNNDKVGHFIAKLRKKKGLTQDELGNMLGISGKSVSKWERGLNMPDISLIYKLSEVFDVDLNQLLNGEDAIKSVVDLQNEENAIKSVVDLQNEENAVNTLKIKSDDKSSIKTKKKSKKILSFKIVIFLIIIVLFVISFAFGFHNKGDSYAVESSTEGFTVDGKLTIKDNGYVLYVSNISCLFEECLTETINTAQYSTFIDNNILFRSGILDYTSKKEKITLDDYLKSIVIQLHNDYKTLGFDNKYFISNLYSMYIHIELVLEDGEIKNYVISLQVADKK